MEVDTVWLSVVTVLALGLSGLVGTVESAVSSISRARVEGMVKDEVAGARSLFKVVDHRANNINLLILLKTLLDATAAVFAAALARDVFESEVWAIVLAIVAVALITYAVVGVFARTMGRKNPYSISLRSAVVLQGVAFVLGPVARVLIWLGNLIAPGSGFRHGPYATEVELREMVDIAQEHGIVEVEERRMIQSVFDLASTTARQVMVPRTEMIWIEEGKHAGQATTLCVRSGHSRVPVVGENMDDILGIVYIKDLVRHTYHLTDGGASVSVTDVMRPATFVPDSKNLDELLHEMQRDKIHMAMLVDEYGGIAGLITMEDILEEIVGEIADEYDIAEVAPIELIGDRTYRAVSRLSLEDLRDQIDDDYDIDIEFTEEIEDQVESVGGLIGYEIGRVPLPNSTVETCGLRLTAEGSRDRRGRMRVRSVVVEVLQRADQGDRAKD
ncbi:Hemolysin, contains CBS domains [Corynebacterium pollutisoli]|uniref:Hemolysin, contains CBS domains n=1 Tax=Corynebacterium pollutisoli TaxID=1610489 RepID=A0A1X7I1S9_9CORY|nr:hemolysin family protein [Corynebacterium pollutisoli]SMG07593.1 Hemolysin, contains CBS domains [Corynebacterium pollutisoli]